MAVVRRRPRAVRLDAAGIEEWWPRLPPTTRTWLMDHNGEALPADVLAAVGDAGGSALRVEDDGDAAFLHHDDAANA